MMTSHSSYAAVTFEGRPVAILEPTELAALADRCAAHRARLAEKGMAQRPEHVKLCAAIEYYHSGSGQTIAVAFAEFSALRREAMQHGYVPPPIHGTPALCDIERINRALQAAIQAAKPLPGEDDALTTRITAAARADVNAIIDAVNGFNARPPASFIDDAKLERDIARAGEVNRLRKLKVEEQSSTGHNTARRLAEKPGPLQDPAPEPLDL